MLQWGHGLSAVDTLGPSSGYEAKRPGFNGATAFQPWIQGRRSAAAKAWALASMGPRPFSRGYAVNMDVVTTLLAQLQWGHGLSAVDTLAYALCARACKKA